jgi:hypothetical protein
MKQSDYYFLASLIFLATLAPKGLRTAFYLSFAALQLIFFFLGK